MPSKPKVPKKKLAEAPPEVQEAPKQPPAWRDTDGLSGEGSESVMTHLQELERQRSSRDKDNPRE